MNHKLSTPSEERTFETLSACAKWIREHLPACVFVDGALIDYDTNDHLWEIESHIREALKEKIEAEHERDEE
jgi:hypothetical protein